MFHVVSYRSPLLYPSTPYIEEYCQAVFARRKSGPTFRIRSIFQRWNYAIYFIFLGYNCTVYSFTRQFNHDEAPIEEYSGEFGQKNRIQPFPNFEAPRVWGLGWSIGYFWSNVAILSHVSWICGTNSNMAKHAARQMRGKKKLERKIMRLSIKLAR